MMQFWILAILLVLAGMAFVAAPLLMRSREVDVVSEKESNVVYFKEQLAEVASQREQGVLSAEEAGAIERELEKKLLSDVSDTADAMVYNRRRNFGLALGLSLLLPVLAVPVYFQLGALAEIAVTEALVSPDYTRTEQLRALEAWREKRPDNGQALFLLGGRYRSMGEMGKAVDAFRRLYEVTGGSSQAAAELAQTLLLANDRIFTNEISLLYREALARDENNTIALELKGIEAYQQERYQDALQVWQRALATANTPGIRQSLAIGINNVRKILGQEVSEVRVQIALSPDLEELPGETRVIVFARETGTSATLVAMPLRVSDLPREVILNEASGMHGDVHLENVDSLDVFARVSLSGDVSQYDYQGKVTNIDVNGGDVVQLLIDSAS